MDGRIVLLNLAGGDCVEDIKKPEADDGFREVLKKAEIFEKNTNSSSQNIHIFLVGGFGTLK